MTSAPLRVLSYVVFPMVMMVIGGTVAGARPFSARVRSAVQHFAAGVVFAAIAGELLPDILHGQAPWQAMLGFVLGVAAMFGVKRLTEGLSERGATAVLPLGLLAAVGIDAVLDGLVIGIGVTAGTRQGTLVTLALTLEMLFLGMATAASMRGRQVGSMTIFGTMLILAVLLGLGAEVGVTVLGGLSAAALIGLLAFGTATLLYLVTEELLISAHDHEVQETPLVTLAFFVGFLVVFAVQLLLV